MRAVLPVLLFLLSVWTPALAQTPSAKTGLVLLPIQGTGMSATDKDQYRAALARSLSAKYEVFSGDEVDKKLEKFAKKTCDAEKCLQEMAIAYQATLPEPHVTLIGLQTNTAKAA